MSGVYGDWAHAYFAAGWRGILPLPANAKKNPPAGYTGEHGTDPSYPDIQTWVDGPEASGNLALRMPRNVLGVDVDAYGDKIGAVTLGEAETRWGVLPPTWRSTSRDDGVSGIRLYRVPEGLAWPGEIGKDIELIQYRHRYIVAPPSIHPDNRRPYRWITPTGIVSTTIPDPDELPPLPDAWVAGLTNGELATSTARNSADDNEAGLWLATRTDPTAAPCARMSKVVDRMQADLGASAHVAARDGTARAARLADEGHRGVVTALTDMRAAFVTEATRPDRVLLGRAVRTPRQAATEWQDLQTSAVNLVTANPSDIATCDCDGQITDRIVGDHPPPGDTGAPAEEGTHPRLHDGASFILDHPAEIPAIWGDGDEVLWASGESLMIVGPPGVGKTTLGGQVLRARLGITSSVLGTTVVPTRSRVLYLAMDRPRQIARSLRRTFAETDRDVLADRLRVWEGPPPGDVAKHPDVLLALARLADADTVVLDSVKDAAVGLTEDEVAAGYNRARQTLLAAGVELLELHHLVKRGVNGAKPTQLADVYGSAWLTAGAGSVVLLWGAAGDDIVKMYHLKQPASEVGPWQIAHDHAAGYSEIYEPTTLVEIVGRSHSGMTAKQVAAVLHGEERAESKQKTTKRALDKEVGLGRLVKRPGKAGGSGGSGGDTYHRAPDKSPDTTGQPPDSHRTANHVPAGQTPDNLTGHHRTVTGHETPIEDGGVSWQAPTCTDCGRPLDAILAANGWTHHVGCESA